ncbi:MAG: phosphohistidine phosphatase SixA [Spirochaetes bacterium]|nr:phosphohistidine phosphatase SixA [Spirochaetota bacterium]
MALYLVQHGAAHPGESDPERTLTDQGRLDVSRIAEVARGYRVKVNAVMHSGKTRARQTAEIFADILGPSIPLYVEAEMGPKDDAAAFAARLDNTADRMYVGHLPFMERLTSFLVGASIERPVFRFQNGGILCLDLLPETGLWVIKWALMPIID